MPQYLCLQKQRQHSCHGVLTDTLIPAEVMSKSEDKRVAWTNNYTNPLIAFGHPVHYDNVKAGERKFYGTKRKPLQEKKTSNENELVFGIRCVV